jgi:cardiolipin hydrolase
MTTEQREQLLTLFTNAISDQLITRKESKEIREMITSLAVTSQDLNIIRSKLFSIAREKARTSNYESIFLWLEEVTKLLIGKEKEVQQDHCELYFSPGNSCRDAICNFIKSATNELKICVFTISDDRIRDEIIRSHNRGVKVEIITDNDKQYDRGSDIRYLEEKGIAVRKDNSPAHMHHKFAIADSRRILTGSYNWTRSAAKVNQENIIVVENQSAVHAMKKEFARLWEQFGI